jgi:hypothetical protein
MVARVGIEPTTHGFSGGFAHLVFYVIGGATGNTAIINIILDKYPDICPS